MKTLVFYRTCVGWPEDDVDCKGGLVEMIDSAAEITRAAFLKHVDRRQMKRIERELGYGVKVDFPMSKDWHVSYHRSKLHGETVYYFQHSGIEYVFVTPEELERILG
jgi:hypothetical protein